MTENIPDKSYVLPDTPRRIIELAQQLTEICRASQMRRMSYYQDINTQTETGRPDGQRSLMNFLGFHEQRVTSHLYSPTMLNFNLEAENNYPIDVEMKMLHASKLLTKNWEHNNTDMLFGQGVGVGLRYGCGILKQYVQRGDVDGIPHHERSLVMPWQFGVYRDDIEELHKQPVMCETNMLSLPEIWKRIWHLPNADDLMNRIKTHASANSIGYENFNFLNQILSTSTLQTTSAYTPRPGGIVNINQGQNYNFRGPMVPSQVVPFHELWLWNGDDYCTIQYVEPDILIAPLLKPCNLLIANSKLNPYSVIRPNTKTGDFWGRAEAEDLIELQDWISETGLDIKQLSRLQIDKILGFQGEEGLTDEKYGQMRDAGFYTSAQGTTITDLTPAFPQHALELLASLQTIFDKIGGFGNVLDGGGEPGVRSAVHQQSLVKTASPTLRDRSLLVERQCATAADLTFHIMRAKDARTYWSDADEPEKTAYLLDSLPEDVTATVDSHSSSPIFADDHTQLIFACVKAGIIDAHSAIELLPLPKKDLLQLRKTQAEKAQRELMAKLEKNDPEAFRDLIKAQGHKK